MRALLKLRQDRDIFECEATVKYAPVKTMIAAAQALVNQWNSLHQVDPPYVLLSVRLLPESRVTKSGIFPIAS